MNLDWYPAIRDCCAHWTDAQMLQQTFQALEQNFLDDNDACIDSAKAIVEVVCRVIVDELDNPIHPLKPKEENPAFGAWVSAAVRILKLGDNRNAAFQKLVSQHHKLTESLGSLRNGAGPVSHGKEAFIERLSAYHRRAAVLSADAIVAFLHQAYLESDLNLAQTREPYERFESFNILIDMHTVVETEITEQGDLSVTVHLPGHEVITHTAPASRFLYHMDREAYIEALNAAKSSIKLGNSL